MKKIVSYGKRIFQNLKFQNKLLFTYFIVGIIPVIIIGFFCYTQTRNILFEREQKNMQTNLKQAVTNMDNQIKIYNNLSDYLAYNQTISQVISYDYKNTYEKYEQYTKVLDPMLSSLKYFHNDLSRITLYIDDNEIKHDTTIDSINEIRQEDWYRQIKDANTKDIAWYYQKKGDKVISVRKMQSLESVDMLGILYLELPASKLFTNYNTLSDSEYSVLIRNQKDQLLYEYRTGDTEDASLTIKNAKAKRYAAVTETSSAGWKIEMYKKNTVIGKNIRSIVVVLAGVVIVCVLLSIAAAAMLSKVMVSRILKLKNNMNTVEAGKMEIIVTSDSRDEVGDLIRGFANMITRINLLIEKVYKGELLQKEYEMKALQAQINPHFLYNSLSLINWKALEAGQNDISKLTLLLSTFYRTALNKGNNILSIGEEVKNVRSYIDIQLMMHDYNFDVEIEIPDKMKEYATLNLILQPLVENAIDHGIDLKEDGRGKISIEGKEQKDDIYLIVSDNGIGMEQEKAQQMLTKKSKGYGLRNVKERIELFFGTDYGVTVTSKPRHGTTICIHMPKRYL